MQKQYQQQDYWKTCECSSSRSTPVAFLRIKIRNPKNRSAFTLVEMLIVITLISILVSVSLISTDTSSAVSLETTARTIVTDLRLARSHAIKFNTKYTVNFDFVSQSYEILHTGSGNLPVPKNYLAGTAAVSDKYIRPVQIPSLNLPDQVAITKLKLKTSEREVSDLEFGPMGGTGPDRNEDTILILSAERNGSTFYIPITVSWVTGQAWLEDIQTLTN